MLLSNRDIKSQGSQLLWEEVACSGLPRLVVERKALKIYRIFHHRMTQLCKSLQISFLFLPLLSAAVVRAFPSVRVKCRVRQFSMIGDFIGAG